MIHGYWEQSITIRAPDTKNMSRKTKRFEIACKIQKIIRLLSIGMLLLQTFVHVSEELTTSFFNVEEWSLNMETALSSEMLVNFMFYPEDGSGKFV
jgi:hypothetical protein